MTSTILAAFDKAEEFLVGFEDCEDNGPAVKAIYAAIEGAKGGHAIVADALAAVLEDATSYKVKLRASTWAKVNAGLAVLA